MPHATQQTPPTEDVLRQLEMVRMQGRFNMVGRRDVQTAAADLDFSELVCFIADQIEDGGNWMTTLTTLGRWSNNLPAAARAEIVEDLAGLTGGPGGDIEIEDL